MIALQAKAIYAPVAVLGYNADIVANGVGPASGSITLDMDGAGYAFMASDFNPAGTTPTRYMPNGGLINSVATSGLSFQLASYSASNSLRLAPVSTDSLRFVTPTAATEVYVLASSGSGTSSLTMTVNFTDGTTQPVTPITVQDWYFGTNYAIQGLGRVNVTSTGGTGIDNNTTDPRLYQHLITIAAGNTAKLIRSITFNKTNSTGVLNVMGISINTPSAAPPCVATPTAPANAASICAGTTVLSWAAVAGASTYDVYLNTGSTATTIVSPDQAGTTYSATTTPGTYAWKIIPKNSFGSATGCNTFTFTVNATVTPSVTIAASPTGTICAGTPVTFTATSVNGGTTPAYQWKKGTANVGTNAATYTDNALASGNAISVVMTSNAACPTPATATSAAITMTVLPRPGATITAATDTTFCQGGSVVLNANAGTGLTYQWLLNGAPIVTATNASYTASASGGYRVAISNGVCTDTSIARTITVKPLPTASITPAGSQTICQGSVTMLTANAGTGYTYQWKRGGADITGETNASYAAGTAGSYQVVVTSNGCSVTSTAVSVTVNPTPGATATAGGPLAFCQGGSVTLTGAASTTTGVSYQWLRNNLITGVTTRTYTATTSGAYRIRVAFTATGCADTSSPALNVNVSTQPPATITQTGTSPICQGSNIRFQSASATGYTYQWYKDGASIPGATTNSYFATTAGAYHVVIINGTCTTITTDRTVVVNPLPTSTASATGATAFCEGDSVVLFSGATTGLTFQWRKNGTDIPGATTSGYTAKATGFYTLISTNSNGCSATSAVINVTVSTMPVAAITPLGPLSFCQSNSVTLSATAGTAYNYKWYLDGSQLAGNNGQTLIASQSGDYTVQITNGTCQAVSPAINVNVITAPPASIVAEGPVNFCQGGTVLLNANRAPGLTYQWTRNGVNVPGATNYQYTASTTGAYSVNIFDGTCPSNATENVTVNSFPAAVITVTGSVLSTDAFSTYQWYRNGAMISGATAQTYTATQDGYYSVVVSDALGCTATSSVQRISTLDIGHVNGAAAKIWPNPAHDVVMIDAPVKVDIQVMSVDGKMLLHANNATAINVAELPLGLYMIRITDHTTGRMLTLQKLVRN